MDGYVSVLEAYEGTYLGTVPINADGTYTFDGLLSNTFVKVRFEEFTGAGSEWDLDAATVDSAQMNLLPRDGTTETINATLAAEGVIEGRMVMPWPGDATACVTAWYSDWYWVNDYCGAVGDSFELHNLPAGSYYLEFRDDANHEVFYGGSTWIRPRRYRCRRARRPPCLRLS